MPPRGYKKGYVKGPDGNWIDPRVLRKQEEEKKPKVIVEKAKEKPVPIKKVKADDDKNHAKVIISWKDNRGRARTTCYTMTRLNIQESISEEFSGPRKKVFMNINLDGEVLEKV